MGTEEAKGGTIGPDDGHRRPGMQPPSLVGARRIGRSMGMSGPAPVVRKCGMRLAKPGVGAHIRNRPGDRDCAHRLQATRKVVALKVIPYSLGTLARG